MTIYGDNKFYVAEAVVFEDTPETYFFSVGNRNYSILQYYKERHNISIINNHQPLIRVRRPSKKHMPVLLVP